MKLRFLRALLVVFAAIASAAAWAQTSTVSVNVAGNSMSGTGQAVINLAALGTENTVSFTLTWDPTVLTYVGNALGSAVPTDGTATVTRNTTLTSTGKMTVLIGLEPGTAYTAGTKELFKVNFNVAAPAASTTIAFTDTPTARRVISPTAAVLTSSFVDATIAASLPPAAPTITAQPQGQTVAAGANVNFSVTATGSPAPTYQWKKDGLDISGANASTYAITGVTMAHAGSYTVVVANGVTPDATSNAAVLTVNKASQTITFGTFAPRGYGETPFALTATASSGLPVSYASSNTSVATINGNMVTIVGAGSTTITASQAGNSDYDAAANATQQLVVNPAAATVTLSGLAAAYDGTAKPVTVTTVPASLAVDVTYNGAATLPIAVGSYAVVATVNNPNFSGSASGTLVIGLAGQTITFGPLSQKVFSDGSCILTATASSGLPITYASSNTAVATVSGSTVTFVATGTTTITASQPGNSSFHPADPVAQVLEIVPALQTITFGPITARAFGDANFDLTATASSGLPVSFASSNAAVATVSGATVTIVGAGTTTITATQAGNANYGPAPAVPQMLLVNKAPATVTLGGLAATYDGTAKVVTATTTPAGLTVAITYAGGTAAPTNAGPYAIVATINEANYAGTASGNLIIAKADQTITFGALSPKTYGDAAFTLSATASSGLPVSFASSNDAIASVSANTVTIAAGGSVTITASQPGNENFNPAAPLPQALVVAKAAATVTLENLAQTYNGAPRVLTAVTSPSALGVVFEYTGTASPTTPPVNAGSYPVSGTINDARYQGSATGTLVVAKAPQTIAFGVIDSKPLDSGGFNLTATSDSGLPIAYAASNPSTGTVATVSSSGAVQLDNTGTITITASQPGNENYLPAAPVDQTLTVASQSQTLTFEQTQLPAKIYGNADFTISATSNRGLTVSFVSSNTSVATVGTSTLAGGVSSATVTIVGAGTTTITAQQPGNADTAKATDVLRTLTVDKASQVITFTAPAAKNYLDADFTLTASSNAGLAPTFSVVSGPATITGSTVTLTGAGTVVVRAAQAGDANYSAAANVDQTITVAKAAQTITFPALTSPVLINAGGITLGATAAPSGLAVSYTSSNSAVAAVSGSTLTVVGLGTTTITAKQGGNENFLAAADVTQSLLVRPVAPVITSTPPTAVTAVQGSAFLYGPIGLNALSAPVTFTLTGLPRVPAGLVVNPTTGNISGIPAVAETPGPYDLVLIATNATGETSVGITLMLQAPAPVITSPAAASAVAGTAFTYTATANPSTGVTFSATGLPSWLALNGAILSGTPTQAGTYTVQLTATNATGSVTLPVVIGVTLPANAPAYVGASNPSGTAGVLFSLTPNFGPGTGTTFAMTGTLPFGLTFDTATGVISGTTQEVGTFPITISATRVGLTATASLNLTFNPAPTAPTVGFPAPGNVRTATVGTAITSIQLTATPAATSFSAVGLPAGLGMTPAGLVTGTPTAPGTSNVLITASNSAGTGPTATLVFVINPHPSSPIITSAPIVSGRVLQALNYTLSASPAGATTYTMSGTLPTGLTFDGAVGTVTGTPAAGTTGSYPVYFAGANTNGAGIALEVIFNIAPQLTVPVITSNGTAAGQVGQAFAYAITATNSPTSYAAAGLPAGLTLNTTTGVITGVPTTATAAVPVFVTLTATNADGASNPKQLLITVAPAPATPVVTSGSSASGRVGQAFTYQITATESPTSYVANGLPAGLSVNPTSGAISGTPSQSGQFEATIAAANAGGLGASMPLHLTIGSAASAPAITSGAAVAGKVGESFSYQITTSGGAATSYAVAGTLPAGLTLNSATGYITGTPTTPGTVAVTLTATGEGGTSLPQPLAITINPALGVPVITSAATATATAGLNFSYTITATNMPGATPFPPGSELDAVNLPAGLAVNPATGVVQGTPSTVGMTTASLYGTNASGRGPIRDLVIDVQAPLAAPSITSAETASAQVGVNFSYQITATNTATSYEVLGAPAWMTINSTSGALAGTPAAPGTIEVQLVASNSAGSSRPRMLTINIAAVAGTPVITSTRNTQGTVSAVFTTYQLTSSPAATTYVATGLPPGLTLNATTGAITGTPTVSGAYHVWASGVNGSGTGAPVKLTFTIRPRTALIVPGQN